MPASLPNQPNLDHLKKSAKRLLAAQRSGDPRCCHLMRTLQRFSKASDADILSARVTLHETQLIVALHFGFSSWDGLRQRVLAQRTTSSPSLAAVEHRAEQKIPRYCGGGVPMGIVAALNHAGVGIGFMEFAASSGWAFSFGYKYDDISPAHMAVRGDPNSDGPLEVFAFLPGCFGFAYDLARTDDPQAVWAFVRKHVDAGTPIMSEHLDGGLISAYQEHGGTRQLFFDGVPLCGWIDVDALNPYAVYVLVRQGEPMPRDEMMRATLNRAFAKGSPHHARGTPQGLAALRAYATDVADPSKDFENAEEWFCWAAFTRLMARRCCGVWLRSVAAAVEGRARESLTVAATQYEVAFEFYERYLSEVSDPEPTRRTLHERARTPERLAVIVPLLERGIAAETAGLEALGEATRAMNQ